MLIALVDAALFFLLLFVFVPVVVCSVYFHSVSWYFRNRGSLHTRSKEIENKPWFRNNYHSTA